MEGRYLIAFGGRPMAGFLDHLKQAALDEDVAITGAVLTDGPGCYNLAIIVANPDHERFTKMLTMALMPAKYESCSDPRLVPGEFVDEVTR